MSKVRKIELTFVGASIVLATTFVIAPGIDLWFSDLLHREAAGFHLRDALWVRLLYDLVHPLTAAAVLGLLALLGHDLVRKRAVGPFGTRAVLFMLATFALGPGLLVNTVLKDQWGRARPRDIIEYGGTREFTPAFVPVDECERNCSFVSGHSSVPFALAALGLFWRRRRRLIYAGAAAFGGLVGLGRIAQGAHFLSDVLFSGILVFAIAYLLARYVFRLPGPAEARAA